MEDACKDLVIERATGNCVHAQDIHVRVSTNKSVTEDPLLVPHKASGNCECRASCYCLYHTAAFGRARTRHLRLESVLPVQREYERAGASRF